MYFNTIDDLKNSFPSAYVPSNTEFIVAGYFSSGDGGGGTFTWVPITFPQLPLNDDGGIIIRPHSTSKDYNNGYFKRQYSGPINVRWFGAIMGAVIYPTLTAITDVTQYVHSARDSNFARNGSLYFPADWKMDTNGNPVIQPYVGAFEFYVTHGEINLIGDGLGSVLQSDGTGTAVLRLGWRFMIQRTARVYNLVVNGSSDGTAVANGVEFSDPYIPEASGKWVFENVLFTQCLKGVYKPTGNIDNYFLNCMFYQCEFGYYAQSVPEMHCGCDKFIGGFIGETTSVGIYVESDGLYGQLILDGLIMEANYGFDIFMKMKNEARMTFNGVEIRNVWMEGNSNNPNFPTVTLDGITYPSQELYFEGVRSVTISQNLVKDIQLKASSVNLYNCKSDNYHSRQPWSWPYRIEVDSDSSLVAYELRYEGVVSENIFVHSSTYDGTTDIRLNTNELTSLWGALRPVLQTGNNNIMVAQHYDTSIGNFLYPGGWTIGLSPSTGVQQKQCAQVNFSNTGTPIEIFDSDNNFYLDTSGYYVWSIHAYLCGTSVNTPDVYGYIGSKAGTAGFFTNLGQVILKPNQWVCSYGVKKLTINGLDDKGSIYLNFGSKNGMGGSIYFCDYQVLRFDQLADAHAYLSSKAFASGTTICEGRE